MLKNSLYARIIACAAGAAMILPAVPAQAAPRAAQQVRQGTDLVLTEGHLNGKLLNANGKPVEGAAVSVTKNGKVVANTVTQKDGSYTVAGLTSGTHTVSVAEGQFPVRLWSKETAPASARNQFTVAQTAVRGQYLDEYGNLIAVTVAVVALTVAIVALKEANENDKPASP
jgi:Carboxypeptidase regulatory-like domain